VGERRGGEAAAWAEAAAAAADVAASNLESQVIVYEQIETF
jgi:hypothetical protein